MNKPVRNGMRIVVLAVALCGVARPSPGQTPQGLFTDVTNIGQNIDMGTWEHLPVISPDGLTLYFGDAMNRPGGLGGQDMWMATRTSVDGEFDDVVNLGDELNSTGDENPGSISADGLTFYFASDRDSYWDMYQATRSSLDEPFRDVVDLGAGVNTERVDGSPSVTADGLSLIFGRRDQGPQQSNPRDIWMATREHTDAEFGDAVPLSPEINEFNESFPCISADGLVLFWADWIGPVIRPGGYGEMDIWVSTRPTDDAAFGPPVNLNDMWDGTQVNDSRNQAMPYISLDWPADGSKLYFVNSGSGVTDLYEATWVSLDSPDGLLPGDANRDGEFDQLDLVRVLQAAKYLTGEAATWGEGDWDGGPGDEPGSPPAGDGIFDQLDIIAALSTGAYLTGPYTGTSATGVATMPVPEPSALFLLVVGFIAAVSCASRGTRAS